MKAKAQELIAELRREAARACLLSRRFEDGCLEHWYEGRYLAYKQSAALLEIALEHDESMLGGAA